MTTNLQQSNDKNYICTAASAVVFIMEAITALEVTDKIGGILS